MKLTAVQSEKISNSTFLVTGGAGFIGSHIAEFLLTAGARKVRVLDNLATGHFRNMAPFANHPHFEFVAGDIRDLNTCKAACNGIDYVFQEAALGSISTSLKNPITTNSENAAGFLNMLVAAHEANIKRFVYASGSSIYDELYADQFARLYGMETIGLRYFNVFGQRQDPQSEYAADIPKFVMQFIRHEPPAINGTGTYAHDFTYVENVVDANMLALFTSDPNAVNQVYNIAVEERTSLDQLAMYLKEFLSAFDKSIADVEITHKHTLGDRVHPVAFVEKAKKLLGYSPCYSLRNGLLKSASWYWAYLPMCNKEAEEKKHRTQVAAAIPV